MLVKELIEKLMPYKDFRIEFTIHKELSDEELKNMIYRFPYSNIKTELEIDDIGYSDKIVCLGCELKKEN